MSKPVELKDFKDLIDDEDIVEKKSKSKKTTKKKTTPKKSTVKKTKKKTVSPVKGINLVEEKIKKIPPPVVEDEPLDDGITWL